MERSNNKEASGNKAIKQLDEPQRPTLNPFTQKNVDDFISDNESILREIYTRYVKNLPSDISFNSFCIFVLKNTHVSTYIKDTSHPSTPNR